MCRNFLNPSLSFSLPTAMTLAQSTQPSSSHLFAHPLSQSPVSDSSPLSELLPSCSNSNAPHTAYPGSLVTLLTHYTWLELLVRDLMKLLRTCEVFNTVQEAVGYDPNSKCGACRIEQHAVPQVESAGDSPCRLQ